MLVCTNVVFILNVIILSSSFDFTRIFIFRFSVIFGRNIMEIIRDITNQVAIVRIGNIPATPGYGLLVSGLATEIVLIDRNFSKAEGEAMDLTHAVPMMKPTKIYAGNYHDCAGAAITVITAGAAQKPGETRSIWLQKTLQSLKTLFMKLLDFNPEGLILIATNPVDILTFAAINIPDCIQTVSLDPVRFWILPVFDFCCSSAL